MKFGADLSKIVEAWTRMLQLSQRFQAKRTGTPARCERANAHRGQQEKAIRRRRIHEKIAARSRRINRRAA